MASLRDWCSFRALDGALGCQALEVAKYDIQYRDGWAGQDLLTIMLLHEKVKRSFSISMFISLPINLLGSFYLR